MKPNLNCAISNLVYILFEWKLFHKKDWLLNFSPLKYFQNVQKRFWLLRKQYKFTLCRLFFAFSYFRYRMLIIDTTQASHKWQIAHLAISGQIANFHFFLIRCSGIFKISYNLNWLFCLCFLDIYLPLNILLSVI